MTEGARLREVIEMTTTVGIGSDVPIHDHTRYYDTDGELLADVCDGGFCDE